MDALTFVERYPIFTELSSLIIETEISIAEVILPSSRWTNPTIRDLLIGLYVAHELALEYRDQLELGQILRNIEKGNDENETKDFSNVRYYSSTVFGIKLLAMIDRKLGTAMFVTA